ncbi:MAG: selenide, water dikinase SelD [Epsilonproteobacteria bacterium]|nr:selenide, water dikinase SelD [Campylobacterota bacterium]OIO17372.1 MAG: selenide, water dikinase SelD [Helicobacteraceae bacterium CG1_02_36_14]PIP10877.1 MAG: selenide, water dikinase SelD [Sulfurimonas sp. CG23_combo_of_CG06-09_8_20_14_all_36_33]PIS26736.1 MAG: selenide, water dikinase SelD [Sulfurimonas sp. CG08_land_8_20_14_0_20_36_33]PIU35054.1 MAG: selenide, water dikinase SelD [Sulfurimonas sp. CG07_land_8_20_14_0_80_36_56]PIV03299.1 MAG: selenide, water dikinase SelD [Sulfurimonas
MESIKLTEYSHGAGCGCKISPMLLDEILVTSRKSIEYPQLLVGNANKDDAAAFDLGNGTSVLSTTDFFMPIVDDAFTFGQIAATNALSDIYAMGGKPLMAISIFGWPIEKLSAEVAREVIDGGRSICDEAGIPLAGGHSIDSPEPIFGLAVTGLVENRNLMQNSNGEEDCLIFITKPLGIGILTTAQKQKKIEEGHIEPAIKAMTTLNKVGAEFAPLEGVIAMTDVTGFGLLGHLVEICEASNISANIWFDKVPLLPNVEKYRALGCIPGGARKNFMSYGSKISEMTQQQREILCDAQTSGGLLVIVKKDGVDAFLELAQKSALHLEAIGETIARVEHLVVVA